MSGEYNRAIYLEDKFKKTRPPLYMPNERRVFDDALRSVREINTLILPNLTLRGHDVRDRIRPIYPEIKEQSVVNIQRLHILNSDSTTFNDIMTYILTYGEEKAREHITDKNRIELLDSAIRYMHYLHRNFKKPDTDFELDEESGTSLKELAAIWDKNMGLREGRVTATNGKGEFGYRGELKIIRPHVSSFSIDTGPIQNIRGPGGILRVDWSYVINREVHDMRWGPNGLYPTDGFFAVPSKADQCIFIIDERSIQFPQVQGKDGRIGDGVQFPRNEAIIQAMHRYFEIASRAIMQCTWHDLILEMPSSIPFAKWKNLQGHYTQYPRQRLAFIDKIVDAFMVDPKMAFQLCKELGIWDMTETFSGLKEKQLNRILDKLPDRKTHFKNVLKYKGKYSVFEILIAAINDEVSVEKQILDPQKDFMAFYEDLFPSGKPRGKG